MRMTFLFYRLKCRPRLFDWWDRWFEYCLEHGYSSVVGVVCCHVDVWYQLSTLLQYSNWIRNCVCPILRNLVTSKMSRSCSEVGCCVKGGSVIFHSLHIGIMPKLKNRLARRHSVILHSSQAATQRYVTCHFPSRRFCGTPPVGRGEGTNYRDSAVLKGLDVLTRWMCCDFSRLTLAGGTEKLFY